MNASHVSGLTLTVLGMGTVFVALSLLSLFTMVFNRVFARRQDAERRAEAERGGPLPPAAIPTKAEFAKPVADDRQAKRKKAAAVAVAVALATMRRPPRPVFRPQTGGGEKWRLAHRLGQLGRSLGRG